MPPQIALFLCIGFVTFLLLLEHKQALKVSFATWIPAIWMLSIVSKPLGVWFSTPGTDMESGSPLDRIFIIGLILMGLFTIIRRKLDWSDFIKKNKYLILLIIFMFASIFWSDIPYISFKRWVRQFAAVIMALIVATEQSPRQAMQRIFRRMIYILIPFSWLLIKYFGEYGRLYNRWTGQVMWTGVTTHKNGLGLLCLISVFFLVWALVVRRQRRDIHTFADVFILVVTIVIMIGPGGSFSATSVTSLVAGLATFFCLLWMKKRKIYLSAKTWVLIMAFIIGFGIATPLVGGSILSDFTPIVGRNETLTGRTDIWAGLLRYVEQRPILGHGFGGFWTTMTIEKFNVGESHNGYVEVLVDLGVFGLLIYTMFLLSCARIAHQKMTHDYDWGSLCICFLLMVLLHNITEATINSFARQSTAVILFLTVSAKATSQTKSIK